LRLGGSVIQPWASQAGSMSWSSAAASGSAAARVAAILKALGQ
jgi:hypothetical protein